MLLMQKEISNMWIYGFLYVYQTNSNCPNWVVAHLLHIKDLSGGRLHLNRFLCHQIKVDLSMAQY